MFGLTSLFYVRDYVQGLHNQWNPSASALEKDEVSKNTLLGVHELATSKGRVQGKENVEVEDSRTKLNSSIAHESSAPSSSTGTPLGFLELDQNKSCFQNYVGLVPNGSIWTPPDSQSYLTHTNRPRNTTERSARDHSLNHNRTSQLGQASLPANQHGKVGSGQDSRDSREQSTTSATVGGLAKYQSLPQRHVPSFPPALRNSGRASSPIVQSGSKLRYLSPLRESSENSHRSAEIEQQNLVVQKARAGAKSVLTSSKPADTLYQSLVRKSSLNSFLSRRSSFTGKPANTRPGKYRIPSAPEVRFFWTSQPVYQSQTSSRATSRRSLRHLPPDKERSLHIGVNNHKLFLLPKSSCSSTPTVTYRLPLREERLTPSLTPFSIIGLGESRQLRSKMAPTFPAGAHPSSTLACGTVQHRGSFDDEAAGSVYPYDSDDTDSDDTDSGSDIDDTLVEDGDSNVPVTTSKSVAPALSLKKAAFFNDLASEIQQRAADSVTVATPDMVTNFPDDLCAEIKQREADGDALAISNMIISSLDDLNAEIKQRAADNITVATPDTVTSSIDDHGAEIKQREVNSDVVATSDCAIPTHSGKVASFFEELGPEIIEQTETGSAPKSMLSMMNNFQVQLSPLEVEDGNSSEVEQTGSYYEFSKSMRAHNVIPVNPMTGLSDDKPQETNNRHEVSGNQVRLTQCKQNPCTVLTDHDEAYSCWHPKAVDQLQKGQHFEHVADVDQHSTPVRELEPSILALGVRNRTHRSVSFAEECSGKTNSKKQFAVYRHSTSLSDPIVPSPLISPRLRGPSFSKELEEHMLTLPMPPVEHSAPFDGRRSLTVSATPSGARSIITLSDPKPKGFWAKVGALFKGCFGAH